MNDSIIKDPQKKTLIDLGETMVMHEYVMRPARIVWEDTFNSALGNNPTPLNSATLLRADTAARLGLTSTNIIDWEGGEIPPADYPTVNNAIRVLHENTNALYEDMNALYEKRTRIAKGSYVGTGNYGSNFPNKLIVGFSIKLVVISTRTTSGSSVFMIPSQPRFTTIGQTSVISNNTVTWGTGEFSWYTSATSAGATAQFNESGITYDYTVMG